MAKSSIDPGITLTFEKPKYHGNGTNRKTFVGTRKGRCFSSKLVQSVKGNRVFTNHTISGEIQ